MRKVVVRIALLALVTLALPLVFSSEAAAQYREFTGRVDRINSKKMIVDNRKGDKVSFVRIDTTEVSGEKEAWDDLETKEDWVTVSWKMIDKPRKAYKIVVLPPREEEGEDE